MIRNFCRVKLDTYKVAAQFKFAVKASFADRLKKLRLK